MKQFQETIKKYSLLHKADKVLVGVSGGPDSVTLLLQLVSLIPTLKLSLHIAHLDHRLRPDSAKDADFVKKLGKTLNLPVTLKIINVKSRRQKGSLEEWAREKRLDFFITLARKIKADKVALGHNLDDQAETVLMRLLRGTGLSGLSGISMKRKLYGITFIRPLLETRRYEIIRFLKNRRIKPRTDPTNLDDVFLRNKIRHSLIPLLKKKYNPNIAEVLASLAESASLDYAYLEQAARRSLQYTKQNEGSLCFNVKKLVKLHPAILRLKLRGAITALKGNTRRINFQHIKEIESLLYSRPDGSIVDLPQGIAVQKLRNRLHLYKR